MPTRKNGTSSSVDQANLLSKLETEIDASITRYFIGKTATTIGGPVEGLSGSTAAYASGTS